MALADVWWGPCCFHWQRQWQWQWQRQRQRQWQWQGLASHGVESGGSGRGATGCLLDCIASPRSPLPAPCPRPPACSRKRLDASTGQQRQEQEILEIAVRPGWKAGTKITFQEKGGWSPACCCGRCWGGTASIQSAVHDCVGLCRRASCASALPHLRLCLCLASPHTTEPCCLSVPLQVMRTRGASPPTSSLCCKRGRTRTSSARATT